MYHDYEWLSMQMVRMEVGRHGVEYLIGFPHRFLQVVDLLKWFICKFIKEVDLIFTSNHHIDELVQERRNYSVLAMELQLSCTKAAI